MYMYMYVYVCECWRVVLLCLRVYIVSDALITRYIRRYIQYTLYISTAAPSSFFAYNCCMI